MSAQNLLFSNLPVSSLGLYDSTTQAIQTINSDASGNINLNSNVNVGNTLQTTGGAQNTSGTITTYDVNCGGSVSAYNIYAENYMSTLDFASTSCTANVLGLNDLSSVPTAGTTGQIFFYDGGLYFYNPVNTTYYQFNPVQLSGPPS